MRDVRIDLLALNLEIAHRYQERRPLKVPNEKLLFIETTKFMNNELTDHRRHIEIQCTYLHCCNAFMAFRLNRTTIDYFRHMLGFAICPKIKDSVLTSELIIARILACGFPKKIMIWWEMPSWAKTKLIVFEMGFIMDILMRFWKTH